MSGKKDQPPPRPPAPKLGLNKIVGWQNSNSAGSSIAIHFNAAHQDSDSDLEADVSSPHDTIKFEKVVASPKSPPKSVLPTDAVPSVKATGQSAATPDTASPTASPDTPSAQRRGFVQPEEDVIELKDEAEKSLFSEIRDKLHDKIQDPLTALMERIEDFSNGDKAEEVRDNKMKKAASFDSPRTRNIADTDNEWTVLDKRNMPAGERRKKHTRHSSWDRETAEVNTDNDLYSNKARSNSLEVVEDFYTVEPFEDFDGNAHSAAPWSISDSHSRTGSNNGHSVRTSKGSPTGHKPSIQRLIKTRPKSSPVKGVSVTLSSLLTNNDGEDVLQDEDLQFFDPEEEVEYSKTPLSEPEPVSDLQTKGMQEYQRPVPWQKMLILTLCLFVYLIVPLPTYLAGMVVGACLATVVISVYLWIMAPIQPPPAFKLEDLDSLPPLEVPEMRESHVDDGKFKGWMNQLYHYNPDDYHINQTHSVYVQLEGTTLRLQTPKHNIPKRAMWNETHHTPHFIHQRHYDITGSKVFFLPPGLVQKRLWSKKYPICIALAKTSSKLEERLHAQEGELARAAGYDILSKDECEDAVLYLFARTGREKEEWFRRFEAASKANPLPCRLHDIIQNFDWRLGRLSSSSSTESGLRHRRQESLDSVSSISSDREMTETKTEDPLTNYIRYMARIMPSENISRLKSTNMLVKRDPKYGNVQQILCEPQVLWLNALLGRNFWDFLREKNWSDKIAEKIQKKLSKLHVPYFIDELTVKGIELGSEVPIIRRASKPYMDSRGLWIDVDIAYSGGFLMSLETKVNLMKLKRTSRTDSKVEKKSPVTDSEEEDSAESTTDDEGAEETMEATEEGGSGGTSKKIWRIVDKIAQSKYFQQATEYKYIKKAMEEVSNTPLMLTVELRSVVGTLAINVPPPPTNRLWYGFRTNPRLWLSARPKVGEREVNVSHVTDWIEKKLAVEFQAPKEEGRKYKGGYAPGYTTGPRGTERWRHGERQVFGNNQRILVMPNMDDLIIPIMYDNLEGHDELLQ